MDDWEKYFAEHPAPSHHDVACADMKTFCQKHVNEKRNIALITSGGTTVPLERNTVRFVDNFSAGTRGAASTEYFLSHGYAVIFLHRDESIMPFFRHLNSRVLDAFQEGPGGLLQLSSTHSAQVHPIWLNYQIVKAEGRLLWLTFTSLSDYLWLLRSATKCLQQHAPKALLYLAAAVSDFYIPQDKIPEHKIQSSSGPHTVTLQIVPKMLSPLVSIWGPELFVVSFKLETDEKKLIEKATGALQKYKHDLVIGNLLHTRREEVTFVTEKSSSLLRLMEHQKAEKIEIEKLIVEEVCNRHKKHIKY